MSISQLVSIIDGQGETIHQIFPGINKLETLLAIMQISLFVFSDWSPNCMCCWDDIDQSNFVAYKLISFESEKDSSERYFLLLMIYL